MHKICFLLSLTAIISEANLAKASNLNESPYLFYSEKKRDSCEWHLEKIESNNKILATTTTCPKQLVIDTSKNIMYGRLDGSADNKKTRKIVILDHDKTHEIQAPDSAVWGFSEMSISAKTGLLRVAVYESGKKPQDEAKMYAVVYELTEKYGFKKIVTRPTTVEMENASWFGPVQDFMKSASQSYPTKSIDALQNSGQYICEQSSEKGTVARALLSSYIRKGECYLEIPLTDAWKLIARDGSQDLPHLAGPLLFVESNSKRLEVLNGPPQKPSDDPRDDICNVEYQSGYMIAGCSDNEKTHYHGDVRLYRLGEGKALKKFVDNAPFPIFIPDSIAKKF